MRSWLAVMACAVAGCGSSTSSGNTVPGSVLDGKGDVDPNPTTNVNTEESAATTNAVPEPARISVDEACTRLAALKEERCDWAVRFPPEMAQASVCAASLESWFDPSTAQREVLEKTVACWRLDCDSARTCMVRAQSTAAPQTARECGQEGTAPVLIDKMTYARRRGVDVKRFGDITTTEQEPIEVCGIEGELEWMTRATCKGGSKPFPTQDAAHGARDSWVANGGRCNSVLDRYTVQCPEATYTVHVDRYICPMP